jgi:hypothetical protein
MAQNNPPFIAKVFLKTLTIIHVAIVAGPLVFLWVTYAQERATPFALEIGDSMFTYFIPFLTVASIYVGNMLARKKLKEAKAKTTLQEKLTAYQTLCIIRYALAEGTALLAIITCGNESNLFYLVFAIVLIAYLVYIRPTKDKIITQLDLSMQEAKKFD